MTDSSPQALATEDLFLSGHDEAISPEVRRQLAALRRATAPYHRFKSAEELEAEGLVDVTGCREHPSAGGMGFHYAFLSRFDGQLRADEPEVLLYEPQRNGKLRLVGVEFIATGAETDEPPVFLEQEMHWNTEFGVWTLHAWVWRHNPAEGGVFADWNPNVSCEFAG